MEPFVGKGDLNCRARTRLQQMRPTLLTWAPGYRTLKRQRLLLTISAVISATLWAYACGDGTTEPPPLPPDPPRPTTVTVSPATAELTALGATVQLSAEVRDQNGAVMSGATVTWASSDDAAATVSTSGLVTAVANGSATITATAGSASGSATVTVAQEVSAVAVAPAETTIAALGDTLRLTAEALDANGNAVAGSEFSWESGDAAVATVDASGLVTAVANGDATITATSGSVSGNATVTVAQEASTVTVTPTEASIAALGDTLRLAAEALDANGNAVAGSEFSWESSDAAVATVDASGLVRGAGEGTATITATAGDVSGTSEITVVNPDRAALVALYNATDGPKWVDNTNWLTDAPLGEWYGVDTDRQGRVVRLHLSGRWDNETQRSTNHGLRGELPDELAHLTHLMSLRLSNNDLGGPIPPELGNLANLERLILSSNDLSGAIPPELGNLANLEWLILSSNGLSGAIPPELGNLANLEWLILSSNGLSGAIPPELGNLANLEYLALGVNDLSGETPPELGDLASLEQLDLSNNNLYGPIPPDLGNLTSLTRLNLYWNELSGPIPPELGNLANLEWLILSSNGLSGAIPPELGNLANLEYLALGVNDLSGETPPELGDLASLEQLDLSNNNLYGPIPPDLGNLTSLTRLNLYWNELSGPIPSTLGNLAKLRELSLSVNDLSGEIPPELGNLTALTRLGLYRNELSGPIPPSFLQLNALEVFWIGENEGLCVPGISEFVAWLRGIERRGGSESLCNAADLAALESLYLATDGANWTESSGWLGDVGVDDWYGVTADSIGHVTELDLSRNGLTGRLPGSLGELAHMTELRIADNADLSGRLPLTLAGLSLRALHYTGTGLCAPSDASFQTWLAGIPSHEGNGEECAPLMDREILEIFYDATGGSNWTNNDNWLTDAPLRDWYGVIVDGEGRVSGLSLFANNLVGVIPPELGKLAKLTHLGLFVNKLSGPIPPELGNLAELTGLHLWRNNLTGPIPSELGNLAKLTRLSLTWNNLTDPIPAELGNLAALEWLLLAYNNLTGPIPSELGNLTELTHLDLLLNNLTGPIPPDLGNLAKLTRLPLSHNNLTGSIPPELGNLANLTELDVASNNLTGPIPLELGALTNVEELRFAYNAGLAGALPQSLTELAQLDELLASGTGLCAPADAVFQAWLETVQKHRIAPCAEGELPPAYLTQAVQSREFPVPLVAGEKALLRVFPTARQATSEGIPLIRARFYLDGHEAHVQDIAGKSNPIPTEVDEGSLARSANVEIAGRVIQPGLEIVIEVDPDGTLDPALGVAKRIPDTGRLAVEVKAMPRFDLTLIPFIWTQTNDRSIVDLVRAMAADPEDHEMLGDARTLLPVGALAVTAHEPVLSSSNNYFTLFEQTQAIRVMEGGTGYYMGMMSPPITGGFTGIADLPGRSSFALPSPSTIAHEFGHNLNLRHAPCGGAGAPDVGYPYPDGSVGAWGYDFRDGGRLVRPSAPDLMSNCGPRWIGDYHFTNALRYRLFDEGSAAAAFSASTQSLLLWGGEGADSVPYLEPAFVIDAPAALPDSAGDYRITGRTAGGGELFSLSFTMPVTADGDGSSSFAFALPVRAGWEDRLATITLSGPGGSVTLDGESDIPMAILRDPRTGQVRGILRDPPRTAEVAADGVGAPTPGLEALFSRGIPGAAAWRR